jgi:hypothetical protein
MLGQTKDAHHTGLTDGCQNLTVFAADIDKPIVVIDANHENALYAVVGHERSQRSRGELYFATLAIARKHALRLSAIHALVFLTVDVQDHGKFPVSHVLMFTILFKLLSYQAYLMYFIIMRLHRCT